MYDDQEAYSQEKQQLRPRKTALLNLFPEPSCILHSQEYTIIESNDIFSSDINPATSLIGNSFVDLIIHPSDRDRLKAALSDAFANSRGDKRTYRVTLNSCQTLVSRTEQRASIVLYDWYISCSVNYPFTMVVGRTSVLETEEARDEVYRNTRISFDASRMIAIEKEKFMRRIIHGIFTETKY